MTSFEPVWLALLATVASTACAWKKTAVDSIAHGFTIYNDQDRLYLCNETYKSFYETSRDLIVVTGEALEQQLEDGHWYWLWSAARQMVLM